MGGSVEINASNVDISSGLVVLSNSGEIPQLALSNCASQRKETFSSLVVGGQGGLIPAPEDL